MAILPGVEISFIRETGSGLRRGAGIVMRATPVDVPPHLIGPVVFGSWLALASLLAWHTALGAWLMPFARAPAAPPRARPSGPEDTPPLADNVLRLPSRRADQLD